MTVQSTPFALQNASHSASVFRNASSAPWIEGGPILPGELWVAAQSTPNMSVQVGAGRAKVAGTQVTAPALLSAGTGRFTAQGMYDVFNDAPISLTVAAADPTNPRIDVAYVAVQDSFYSGAGNQAVAGIVTGVPAVTPVAPLAPVNAVALANISVAANQTSVTNANITNLMSPAILAGSCAPFTTLALLNSFTPAVAGTYADVYADANVANNGQYRWSGTAWVYVGVSPVVNVTAFGGGISATPGSAAFTPRVMRTGNRVDLVGSLTCGSSVNNLNLLTVPAAFQPPTPGSRFVGTCVSSLNIGAEFELASGTLLIPNGYVTGTGIVTSGSVLPLTCSWIMD